MNKINGILILVFEFIIFINTFTPFLILIYWLFLLGMKVLFELIIEKNYIINNK